MRRIVSLALVCLLVLRGLLGDAMAMELMAGMGATHHAVAPSGGGHARHADPAPQTTHAGEHHAAAPDAHCAGHAPADDGQAHTHCTACALCHSPLGQPESPALATPEAAAGHATPRASRFASATPAQVIKPPIS
jgi:hypothetical protein